MTGRTPWITDRTCFRVSCWLYSRLLLLHPDILYMRYGEEMQWVFRKELKRAARTGPKAYLALWCSVIHDTVVQVGPLVLPSVMASIRSVHDSIVLVLLGAGLFFVHGSAQRPKSSDLALARRIDSSPLLSLTEERLVLHAPSLGWALGAVSGVAVGVDGSLYVIQRGQEADPILVFDQRGNLLRSWGKGDFTLPHSLRLDAAGHVWAVDAGASRIIEYSPTGDKLLTIAIQPVPENGSPFRGVTDLAFAPNGHVFVTDGYGNARVLEYTTAGTLVREWGHPGSGPGEFHLPHAIQISPSGTVYVADRENGRIEEFDIRGTFLRELDELGRCYALELHSGVLWATIGPGDQEPGAPGWLIKLDPTSGTILGHLAVPDQRAGHALDVLNSDEPVMTAGSGLLMFRQPR